mgnify:CR=1 FL=1
MSILDELAAHARERVLADSENMSLDILQAMCREKGRANGARFYDALKKDDLSFICEVKKASPSKGVIARDFPYLDIARDYEAAGADCISCLTEPKWFLGSDDIFREIRAAVSTPMLRKDFTVSDYQLYQSRLMGADCVLLICALLDTKALAQYLAVCDELGLSALVETHDADEIRSAVAAGAKIIGVNSLGYLSLEDVVKLADNTENGFCTACFGGVYPTSIPKDGGKDRFECKISEGEKKKNA